MKREIGIVSGEGVEGKGKGKRLSGKTKGKNKCEGTGEGRREWAMVKIMVPWANDQSDFILTLQRCD